MDLEVAEQLGYIILGCGMFGAFTDFTARMLNFNKFGIMYFWHVAVFLWYAVLLAVWAVLFGRITIV